MFDREDYLIEIYSAASNFISEQDNLIFLEKLKKAIDDYEDSEA